MPAKSRRMASTWPSGDRSTGNLSAKMTSWRRSRPVSPCVPGAVRCCRLKLKGVASQRKGRLNPSNLYRLSIGNPKVFQKEATQTGIDTAVHVLLDASGSMSGEPMRLASLACYAVGKALEHAKGISVGITAFPAFSVQGAAICPLLEHGKPLTDNFKITAYIDTPLAEALWWTLQVLVRRKERRKLLLILTDGQPNTWVPSVEALRQITAGGTEVYGIGLNLR